MSEPVSPQPPPDMDVEKTFNLFVEGFGGELVSKLLTGKSKKPDNADYFFFDRTIVAELKCLEKDYTFDASTGDKLNAMINRWVHEGHLRPEQTKRFEFQTDDLPYECRVQMFDLISAPIQRVIEKANKQIKATKKHFGLADARGLLILANDGNYSMPPMLLMQTLGRLFKSKFSGIDSFIFFTLNVQAAVTGINQQVNVWISGKTRNSGKEITPERLHQIQQGWTSFLSRLEGEPITKFVMDDYHALEDIKLLRRDR